MYALDGSLHVHRPFLDRLAEKKSDAPCSLAAFLLLNALDGLRHPNFDEAGLLMRVQAAYHPLASVSEKDPQVSYLVRLAESIRRAIDVRNPGLAIPEIFHYAEWLRSDSRFEEGLEVLNTGTFAIGENRPQQAGQLHRGRGMTLRSMGQYQGAATAFERATKCAKLTRNRSLLLRSQNGLAKSWMYEGRFDSAKELLERILADAESAFLDSERACITHDLAIASKSKWPRALALFGDAYKLYKDEGSRDRLRSDLCRLLIETGFIDEAASCASSIKERSLGTTFRAIAIENEMRIASYLHDRKGFDKARAEFEGLDRTLAPSSEADLNMRMGQGFMLFGDMDAALFVLTESLQVAERIGYAATAAEAKRSLKVLQGDLPIGAIRVRRSRAPLMDLLPSRGSEHTLAMLRDAGCLSAE